MTDLEAVVRRAAELLSGSRPNASRASECPCCPGELIASIVVRRHMFTAGDGYRFHAREAEEFPGDYSTLPWGAA
jgi:hypothetical protein